MRSNAALTLPHSTRPTHKEHYTGMADSTGTLQFSDDDIAFLLTLLRNASTPLTTQDLVDALKKRSGR
jgi:hypothetical protein